MTERAATVLWAIIGVAWTVFVVVTTAMIVEARLEEEPLVITYVVSDLPGTVWPCADRMYLDSEGC